MGQTDTVCPHCGYDFPSHRVSRRDREREQRTGFAYSGIATLALIVGQAVAAVGCLIAVVGCVVALPIVISKPRRVRPRVRTWTASASYSHSNNPKRWWFTMPASANQHEKIYNGNYKA
jgi:hypothetical protein